MSSPTPTIFAKAFSNLAYIDLFGKAVQLNFNKGTKSRTKTGGFFTILFLGFWIWAVYNFGKDIYERKNPIMSTADTTNSIPKPMLISPQTFSIAFGYSEPLFGNLYKNNSIFTIKVVLQTVIRTKNSDGTTTTDSIETVLDTEDCTPEHFGESDNQFSDLPLDQLTCIKQKQTNTGPLVIEGAHDSKIWKSLQISVLPCDSATSSVTCGSDDELDYYLGGRGYFAAYFTDMALNTRDYGDPITPSRNNIFTLFGNKGYKEIYFMLEHMELTTDIGWFTKDLSQESYIKYNGFSETTTAATSDALLKFQIRISTTTKQVTRSYIKIQDIFAQANGLATVALMALLFVMTPYANLKFNESIINELFEIKSASIALKNSKPVSSLTRGVTQNHKKTNQSDLDSEEGENQAHPPNTNDVLLSIMKEDKEKNTDFETIGSPRPLLKSKSSEAYQYSDDKNDKDNDPQLESPTDNSSEISKGDPHISLLQVPEAQETKPTSPRHTPKKLSNFANMSTPSNKQRKQTYVSGPNSLGMNKPQDQKPTSKNLDQEEPEFQSIEIMLQGFPTTEDDRNTKPFYPKKNDKELEQISEVNSSMEAANSFMAEKYYNPSYPDFTPQRSPSLKKRDSKSLDNQLTSIAHTMKKKNEEDCLNITFWDYLQSFVRKSDHYKQKIKLLNAGIDMINERLDIFELFKTFRELEKLKLLLLDYEQAVLFENLPKPVLQAQADKPTDVIRSYPKQLTRTGKLVSEDRKSTEVCQAYKNLALRRSVTAIDEKLLKAYDERY